MTTLTDRPLRAVPPATAQVTALTVRTLHDRWRSTAGWAVGLALIGTVQLAVYPSVAKSSANMQAFVNEWPKALREAFNLDLYTTGAGFLNAEMFSMIIPLVLIAVTTTGAAAATAGEEERGTADLLLSTPISRSRVLLSKGLAILAALLTVAVVTLLTIGIGAPFVDLEVGIGHLGAAILMTSLLALVFGGLTLLIAVITGHRTLALGTGIGVALAAFLLNALAPMASWLEPWQKASPFHWALGENPLVNGVDTPMAGLLLAVSCAFVAAAFVAYGRRDIGGR